jgi:hypothetical protein
METNAKDKNGIQTGTLSNEEKANRLLALGMLMKVAGIDDQTISGEVGIRVAPIVYGKHFIWSQIWNLALDTLEK